MLEPGSMFEGIYRVQGELGHGGQSHVYLVRNERANKLWAVKEVDKNGGTDKDVIRQNLVAEADILKQLQHKHLPTIVDVIEKKDAYYIIMDYIEGVTLYQVLEEQGRQPQEKVVKWALQVCQVFQYLHSQKPKIIYRDCKPKNIMLKPDGDIMVIDFGAAREYKAYKVEDTIAIGTRGYAAPEQYGDVAAQSDERTDIYNLGATMYHLVTGHNPSKKPYDMYPIRHWDASLSSGLEQIILKCTKKNPEERYQNVSELIYALEHYTELEFEYRKKQRVKRALLGMAVLLSGLCFAGSAVAHAQAKRETDTRYEYVIRNAQSATTKERQVALYREAAGVKPEEGQPYMELLERVYLADDNFSQNEADEMTELLGSRTDGTTYESRLSENREDYDAFAYNIGLAYFYYYNETGNKPMSEPWLTLASQSETLLDVQKERALRLSKVAGYYNELNVQKKTGDAAASYMDYWNDMSALTTGNIVEQDNARTAAVMYADLSYQMRMHIYEFKKAGVARKDFEEKLDSMLTHLQGDFSEEQVEFNEEMIRSAIDNIDSAKSMLDRVFGADTGKAGDA